MTAPTMRPGTWAPPHRGVAQPEQPGMVDARDRVTGKADYVINMALPGMLHAMVLRSTAPHAKIVRIDTDQARQLPGVMTVLTGAASTSAQSQELNVYSSRHYDIDKQLYEGFTAKTGIKVKVISAAAEQLVERIKREGAQSPGDVMITVDIGNLWRAQSEGLFQPIKSAELEKVIPAHLRDPNGEWFGLSMRAQGDK